MAIAGVAIAGVAIAGVAIAGVAIAGVTIMEGGMETDERERARRPRRGAQRPVSLFPRGHVIPAKAGTYWRRHRLQYPLPPRSRRPLPL